MATTIVVRGTTVQFSTLFYTASGAATNPTNAAVYVNYPVIDGGGVSSTTAAITMTQNVNTWTASWESKMAMPGPAYWTVISSGAAGPYTREDGTIKLTASPSNPD